MEPEATHQDISQATEQCSEKPLLHPHLSLHSVSVLCPGFFPISASAASQDHQEA